MREAYLKNPKFKEVKRHGTAITVRDRHGRAKLKSNPTQIKRPVTIQNKRATMSNVVKLPAADRWDDG